MLPGRHSLTEIRRFPDTPIAVEGTLRWDVQALWNDTRHAIADTSDVLTSIGVDAWGRDCALLDERGDLVERRYHSRDHRTDTATASAFERIPPEEIYRTTGIQFLPFNTLFQLHAASMQTPDVFDRATALATIPALMHYWLTGRVACEDPNATTTQCVDARTRTWATTMLERLGLSSTPCVSIGTHQRRSRTRDAGDCCGRSRRDGNRRRSRHADWYRARGGAAWRHRPGADIPLGQSVLGTGASRRHRPGRRRPPSVRAVGADPTNREDSRWVQTERQRYLLRQGGRSDRSRRASARRWPRKFGYAGLVLLRSQAQMSDVIAKAPAGFGKAPDEYRCDVAFLDASLVASTALETIRRRDGVDEAARVQVSSTSPA